MKLPGFSFPFLNVGSVISSAAGYNTEDTSFAYTGETTEKAIMAVKNIAQRDARFFRKTFCITNSSHKTTDFSVITFLYVLCKNFRKTMLSQKQPLGLFFTACGPGNIKAKMQGIFAGWRRQRLGLEVLFLFGGKSGDGGKRRRVYKKHRPVGAVFLVGN